MENRNKLFTVSDKNYRNLYVEAKSFDDAERKAILFMIKDREKKQKEWEAKRLAAESRGDAQPNLSLDTFENTIDDRPFSVYRIELVSEFVIK